MTDIKTSRTAESRIIDFDAVSTSSGRFGIVVQKRYFPDIDMSPSKAYIMELWEVNDETVASFTEYTDFIKYYRIKGISIFQHEIDMKLSQIDIDNIYSDLRSFTVQHNCLCIPSTYFVEHSIEGLDCISDARLTKYKAIQCDTLRQTMKFNYEKNKIRIV